MPTGAGASGSRAGASARIAGSPALPKRELLLLAAGALLLAVVMTWPLVLHLDRDIAQDLGDPIRTAWQVAWGAMP